MATYQCQRCGKEVSGQSGTPSTNPFWNGYCAATPNGEGRHLWVLVGRYIKTFFENLF